MDYGAHENGDTTVGHSCWAAPHKQPVYNSGSSTMESMKMKLFVALVVMLMAISNVAAQEAPAPAPTSDASVFVPTAVASLVALSFGFLL
ncbi:arabinogalactan peptide 13 [Artemisia annua]|uniref:Arabinogalactan peptide 13 n=1 Tax=Artemisia annua TaxID=35608 RepID=A0A2U1QKC0_ARTAN|nr:arabinogalactan peptide 13 [Artemisia annua]